MIAVHVMRGYQSGMTPHPEAFHWCICVKYLVGTEHRCEAAIEAPEATKVCPR